MSDPRGNPRVAVITSRDLDGVFAPLTRHRYLPVDYLHAFAGGSLDYLVNRLSLLFRQPNRFLDRPLQQRAHAAANHRRIIYELADKGWARMIERGIVREAVRPPPSFAHELMTSLLTASFELGAKEAGVRLIGWSQILASKSLPENTRSSNKPYAVPVRVHHADKEQTIYVAADGRPFGIARIAEDLFFFCPGIEADCATEPLDTSDFQRSSLYRKFLAYLSIERDAIYRSHFGFPNLYIPIVTTNATRLASMMRLLERMTRGAGSKSLLFKTFPPFNSPEKLPPPSGHMLLTDWQRVGHPPFNFLRS